MGLYGECEDCGRAAHLRFKPDPIGDESRPTVCDDCHAKREEMMRDHYPAEDRR